MAVERYANAKTLSDPTIPDTTLTALIDAVTTSIPLASLANLPAAAPFRILIGDELLLVTVRAIPATATRNIEGTTAAIHASGAEVFHVLTAGGLLAATVGGLQIEGVANPITVRGGDDGAGNTAIVFDNVPDAYVALNFDQQAGLTCVASLDLRAVSGSVRLLGSDDAAREGAILSVAAGDVGGHVAFTAGSALSGNTNGGNVTLTAGAKSGAGTAGAFAITLQGGAFTAIGASGYSFDAAVTATSFVLSGGGTLATQAHVASGAVAFTNKTGAISQWTNDAGYTTAAAVITYVGGLGYITTAASALLSATHTDTTAGAVARGDLITGQGGTPKWVKLAIGTAGKVLQSDGTDISWATPTGTGVPVLATTPTLVTPVLGVATGTSLALTEAVGASALTVTGATQVTSFPVITATQTWNASGVTFTAIKLNVTATASAAASMLLDLQVAAASVFSVRKDGVISATSVLLSSSATLGDGGSISWGSRGGLARPGDGRLQWYTNGFGANVELGVEATGVIQMGVDVNGAPVTQTFKAHDGITGADVAGATLQLASGRGTGAGAVSQVLIQTPTVLGSSATAQTLTTRLTIDSSGIKATGYLSADGSAGITGGPYTSVTVKNGLVVAGS